MTPEGLPASLRATRASIPALRPMLAKPAPAPFDSQEHLFEVAWGGIRTIVTVEGGAVRAHGRNLADLLPYFPELERLPKQLSHRGIVLDGDIVALDRESHPDASLLRKRLDGNGPAGAPAIYYQVSDILYFEGRPVLSRPLAERRRLLRRVLTPSELATPVEEVGGEGIAFYQAAVNLRLPGVIAKDQAGIYLPGRVSDDWREIRVEHSAEFVVGGYTLTARKRKTQFGGLLLGVPGGEGLTYAGHVTGSFSKPEIAALESMLAPLVTSRSPFTALPGVPRLAFWCRPEVVAGVRFSGWTPGGLLRFPLFGTLRPDLAPRDCAPTPAARAAG